MARFEKSVFSVYSFDVRTQNSKVVRATSLASAYGKAVEKLGKLFVSSTAIMQNGVSIATFRRCPVTLTCPLGIEYTQDGHLYTAVKLPTPLG